MARVGIVTHDNREAAAEHATEMTAWLIAAGHDVVSAESHSADRSGAAVEHQAPTSFGDGLDLLVSLGGDGSILRAVDIIGHHDVPILGVNYGELGYLAAVEPADARNAIERALVGQVTIERRMMVQAELDIDGATCVHHALNEIVVERGATSTTIRVEVSIDGEVFHTYAADGIIVASPTGSTAYALSARGPVLAYDHQALLVTPVSPHQLFDRSMVLAPTSIVELEVKGHREARVAVDGRTISTLDEGQTVRCSTSPRVARLVTVGTRQFHHVLKAKFGLRDR